MIETNYAKGDIYAKYAIYSRQLTSRVLVGYTIIEIMGDVDAYVNRNEAIKHAGFNPLWNSAEFVEFVSDSVWNGKRFSTNK
jgi:hypothetical protein